MMTEHGIKNEKAYSLCALLIAALITVLIAQTLFFESYIQIYNRLDNYLPFTNGDDIMRALQVKDLLHGQSWFDVTQYRFNPPFGGEMHWSRLVDVPIAALLWVSQQIFGEGFKSESLAFFLWPACILFCFYYLMLKIAMILWGRKSLWPAIAVLAWTPITAHKFYPLALDHHNIMLTLLIAALASFTSQNLKGYVATGLFAGLCVSIGFEVLPYIAIMSVFIVFRWVLHGDKVLKMTTGYIWALATTVTVAYVITTHPENYVQVPYCDALTGNTVLFALTGAGLWSLTLIKALTSTWVRRAIIIGCIGCLAILLHKDYALVCTQGPYAQLTPYITEQFINKIGEVKGLGEYAFTSPIFFYNAVYILVMSVVLGCVAWKTKHPATTLIALCAGLSFILAFDQVRSLIFAEALCSLGAIALLRFVLNQYPNNIAFKTLTILMCIPVFIPGIISFIPQTGTNSAIFTENPTNGHETISSVIRLNKLPKSTLMTNNNGPFYLSLTHHNVATSAYHRNKTQIEKMLRVMKGDEEEAKAALRETKSDYLVVNAPVNGKVVGMFDSAFMQKLILTDWTPDWLERIKIDGMTTPIVFKVNLKPTPEE